MENSAGGKHHLLDVRQIGPNSERDISGVCSGCGATLFVALPATDNPSRAHLEERLQSRFAVHVAEQHGAEDDRTMVG